MTKKDLINQCAEEMGGLKTRFLGLNLGVIFFFAPGLVTYCLLHAIYKNKDSFPGFEQLLDVFESGE